VNDKEIVADYGLGRNCTLFDKTRKWAYRAIRQGWPEYEQWLEACYERASAYNLQFSLPLDEREVHIVARSIAKWTFSRFSQATFSDYVERTHSSEIQKKRGAIGGKASRGGGRPKEEDSTSSNQPWVNMNISRRTYYYRMKNGK